MCQIALTKPVYLQIYTDFMIFSNLIDRIILCWASDRQRKKVKFRGIFRDKFPEKSADFAGMFGANFAENQSVKKADFVVIF